MSAERRARDLDELHREFTETLPTGRHVWLAVTLVPSNPGFGSMRPNLPDETKRWLTTLDVIAGAYWNTRVGYRSVRGEGEDHGGLPRRLLLRLDGAGGVARCDAVRQVDGRRLAEPQLGARGRADLDIAQVLEWAVGALLVLTSHARRVGATGSADVAVQLFSSRDTITEMRPPWVSALRIDNSRVEVPGPSRTTRRTVDLSALPDDPRALLQAAVMLSLDVVSEFGHSDLGVVDEHGELVRGPFDADKYAPALAAWFDRATERTETAGPRDPGSTLRSVDDSHPSVCRERLEAGPTGRPRLSGGPAQSA